MHLNRLRLAGHVDDELLLARDAAHETTKRCHWCLAETFSEERMFETIAAAFDERNCCLEECQRLQKAFHERLPRV